MENKKKISLNNIVSTFTLKTIEEAIVSNASKKVVDNVETDHEFIENMLAVAEHATAVQKQIMAKRADLTEEQYQLIEGIGDVHYKCNIFNETSAKDITKCDQEHRCLCGCKRAFGEPLPYCINEEQQTFFGPGIILFFYFTKRMFLILVTICIIYGVFAITSNMHANNETSDCESPGFFAFMCQFKIQSSVQAKTGRSDLMIVQLILGMVMCIFWSFAVRLIRNLGRKKQRKIDDLLDSASDYCLLLENLPAGKYSEEDILRYLNSRWCELEISKTQPLRIRAVQIIYKMNEVRERIEKIQTLAKKIVKYVKVTQTKNGKVYNIDKKSTEKYISKKKQILEEYKELKMFRLNFVNIDEFRMERSSSCVIVEFETSQQKVQFNSVFGATRQTFVKDLLRKLKAKITSSQQLQGKTVKIYRSPQPSDIFWKHCQNPVSWLRVFAVWMINFVLIALSLTIAFLINGANWLAIVAIITINLFNRLIWNVLLNVIFIEENHTKTANIISVMNKSFVTQTINLIVVPMIVSVGINDRIDGVGGLTGQIHDFQLTAFIFMTLFNLINVPHRIVMLIQHVKCLRRMAIRYYCRVTGELDTIDQMKDALTFLYDPPAVPVAGLYVYITTVMSQAAFYCHLSPIILIYLVFSLILFHLINKYMILRMSKIPDMIDFLVFETVVGYALNFPLLYGIGSIIFLSLRGDAPNFGYYIPSIICIIVWFLSVQSPFGLYKKIIQAFVDRCCVDKEEASSGSEREKNVGSAANLIYTQEDMMEKQISKRKENFYGSNGTNEMFNMENKLQEAQGPFHNHNKKFCQRFNLINKEAKDLDEIYQINLFSE